jgi:PAS domain S-box-containing protein
MSTTNPPPIQHNSLLPSHFTELEIINSLPVAIYLCDLEGRITYFNKAAEVLWGRSPEIGKDRWCGSFKIFNPDGSPMPIDSCPMAITLREGRPVYGAEIVVERPDGSRVDINPNPHPIFDTQGKMCGARNMLVDITDVKKKEQALQESEQRYKHLSESLEKKVESRTLSLKKSEERYHKMVDEVQDYAILLLDINGNIVNWNKGAENIKGYTEKEIVGKNFSIFYLKNDRDTNLPQNLIREASVNGRATHEGWRLRKDGTMFWGYVVITALHDDQGSVIGFSKVTRDLTAKKLADDKLRDYARDIELRNKQLEEYAYIASHDLQEPLRKILTFGDLIQMNIGNDEAVLKHLSRINAAAQRMSALIKDVLKYSQVSVSDELFMDTDLNEIFATVCQDFDLLIEQKGVTITSNKLPVVRAVPIQMHQLFSNLIGNAIKFSEENPMISVTAESVKAADVGLAGNGENYTRLTFKDNGTGFDQQYAGQIFKLFKRLDTGNTGTGIGLALCKKIVDSHQGHIMVTSEPGKGTTFEIYLPIEA